MENKDYGIIFKCSHCSATLKAPGNTNGKKGTCPNCKHKLIIPGKPSDTEMK